MPRHHAPVRDRLKTVGKYESHPFSPPSDAPLSAFALDQHVRTLKGFATWLHEKQYTRHNVLKTLERPKTPKLTVEPLSNDEIKRILASINTRPTRGHATMPCWSSFWTRDYVPGRSAA